MTGALAGAQWKLSLREDDRGLVIPVVGESGSWIAKFHDPSLPGLPRVEFVTATWARASGIDVPTVRLGRCDEVVALPSGIPTGDGSVYLIERFDRASHGRRIHMEDFGQVLDRPPGQAQFTGSAELIAAVITGWRCRSAARLASRRSGSRRSHVWPRSATWRSPRSQGGSRTRRAGHALPGRSIMRAGP